MADTENPEKAGILYRGLLGGRAVRLLGLEARSLAQEVQNRHELTGAAAQFAGELAVATVMLSAYLKGSERIQLQVQSERPRMAFVADMDADGGIRARLTPSRLRQVRGAQLNGMMMVTKSDGGSQLYRGVTEFQDCSIEEALSQHLNRSDQVDVVLRVHSRLDKDGQIAVAGGVLLERLPEDPKQPWLTHAEFADRYGILKQQPVEEVLTAFAFGMVAGEKVELLEGRSLYWRCSCSTERIEQMLCGLGSDELQQMRDEDGQAEVTCHFCTEAVVISAERLDELIATLVDAPSA